MRNHLIRSSILMKVLSLVLLSFVVNGFAAEKFDNSRYPARLKRTDSFLGIHFDFHANPNDKNIGANTTPAMIENIINLVHPDYLQIDCKGHPGFSSYPTRVGNPVPGIVGNPLRVWREVTAKRGVALYMHYSGVWDSAAVSNHADWAAINADGKTNNRITSVFGPYADQLLIPQLRELAGAYGVDGAWVDGECWASVPDYGETALKAFRDATGIQEVPRKPGDSHWFEFLQFHREAFRKYLRYYVTEMKNTHPNFQLCSNWAFTDHMAEPVSAPVDFLSGDYSPDNSVNSARLSARYLLHQGMPWDLMAWSFSRKKGKDGNTLQKSAPQLQREAAIVVSLGGGFQAYFKQKRDGSIYDEQMPVMAEVAKFCRARQELCHHSRTVPQIALLLSTAGHYREINGLFNRNFERLNGILQALLESQYPVDVMGEHHLAGRMSDYPLIIVPEWGYLEPAFKNDLVAYVKKGGNLLLIGPKSAALFQSELAVSLDGEPADKPQKLCHNGMTVTTKGFSQKVKPGPGVEVFGSLLIGTNAVRLFPKPIVEIKGSVSVDVALMRNHGKLLVNLVNTSGPHQTEPIQETIQPVGPLTVTIRQPTKPAKITLEPGCQPLAFEYCDGEVRLTVQQVDIHRVIVVE